MKSLILYGPNLNKKLKIRPALGFDSSAFSSLNSDYISTARVILVFSK